MRLSAEAIADLIREHEISDTPAYAVADPSIFTADGGPSIAERMSNRGVHWRPADNARVARMGAVGGWDLVRQRLVGEDGAPMLYMFDTCRALIRTLSAAQHDTRRPEDMLSE